MWGVMPMAALAAEGAMSRQCRSRRPGPRTSTVEAACQDQTGCRESIKRDNAYHPIAFRQATIARYQLISLEQASIPGKARVNFVVSKVDTNQCPYQAPPTPPPVTCSLSTANSPRSQATADRDSRLGLQSAAARQINGAPRLVLVCEWTDDETRQWGEAIRGSSGKSFWADMLSP